MMWILFPALLGLSSAMICPDGDTCESGNTCCKNLEGQYLCCPLPNAECCSDHLHCCYEGTLCDLVHGRCVNRTVSLPWRRRLPPRPAPQLEEKLKAVVCPDRESECPDDTTCCQMADGSWGCCLFTKAVCCEDKRHCCPEGTTCDLQHSKCQSASLQSFPMLEKGPARRRGNHSVSAAPPVGSVSCPDGSSCPDSYTCCLLSSGAYGCCPYAQATCCSDHLHCCPSNTECDLERGICKEGETLKKIVSASNGVECPDHSECPDQTTCCKVADYTYGCCPMPNAICCSDRIHCCPEGTDCDVVHSACVSTRRETAITMTTLEEVQSKVAVVTCNGTAVCADGNTCCKLPNGGWACCSLPKAVCCEDHLHCCPHGTVCNLEASTCDDHSAGTATPWRAKIPASPAPAADGKCDELTSCPGKSTCCKTQVPARLRLQKVPARLRLQKVPARLRLQKVPALPTRNMCDAQTSCPRDTTCCFMGAARRWGCCPLPQAVCCEDGLHCCPGGHACEPHRSACSKGPLVVVPWFSKLSALSEPGAVTDVKCDDKSSCASGTTCCKLKTGEWGCCPLVKAVCCADREHCCPQGYTCNMETGTCEKTNRAGLPLPQVKVVRPDAGDVPCDAAGEFRCSERDTCCRVSASEWACCPSPRAVCCPGSRHCCPAGHSCDPAAAGCSQRSHHSQLTWDAPVGDGRRL
ncbi:granulin b isoform X1 [Cyclopterus lumpus]|uniref:granulin b isoform X1 n=1 Tax=Cyclopterus lumpus TaxID=8103 RepID=UPI001486E3E0|nr:granulin b isoform X1 [Cyclopterus lumpus]